MTGSDQPSKISLYNDNKTECNKHRNQVDSSRKKPKDKYYGRRMNG